MRKSDWWAECGPRIRWPRITWPHHLQHDWPQASHMTSPSDLSFPSVSGIAEKTEWVSICPKCANELPCECAIRAVSPPPSPDGGYLEWKACPPQACRSTALGGREQMSLMCRARVSQVNALSIYAFVKSQRRCRRSPGRPAEALPGRREFHC